MPPCGRTTFGSASGLRSPSCRVRPKPSFRRSSASGIAGNACGDREHDELEPADRALALRQKTDIDRRGEGIAFRPVPQPPQQEACEPSLVHSPLPSVALDAGINRLRRSRSSIIRQASSPRSAPASSRRAMEDGNGALPARANRSH